MLVFSRVSPASPAVVTSSNKFEKKLNSGSLHFDKKPITVLKLRPKLKIELVDCVKDTNFSIEASCG